MTDSICGATKRDGSGDCCEQPAGWGTNHVGEGRCKLHGGKAGAPNSNQNAAKHALNSDPHHYFQSLSVEEKEFIEQVSDAIQDRVRESTRQVDYLDRILSRQIAIELHIVSKAMAYVERESGLAQDISAGQSSIDEPAPLLEEVRQYTDSIFKNLKEIGVLDDPDSQKADALESWRASLEEDGDP